MANTPLQRSAYWFTENYFKILVYTYVVLSFLILFMIFIFNLPLAFNRLIILLVIVLFSGSLLLAINFSYLLRTKPSSKELLKLRKIVDDEAKEQVTNCIEEYMKDDKIKQMITEAINKEIKKNPL